MECNNPWLLMLPRAKQLFPRALRSSQEARVLCSSQAEIPIQFIFPGVFAVIIYLLTGLPLSAKPFLLFIAYVVLTSNAAVSLG